MAIKDIFKINRKTFVDPGAWLGYNSLKTETSAFWSIIKASFKPERATRTETFEDAVKRLELSPADVSEAEKDYFFYAMLFVVFAAFTFLYSFLLLIYYGTFAGFVLALAVTSLFLSQAFRFHFWYFQIKKRKLGCTFQEWRQETFHMKGGNHV